MLKWYTTGIVSDYSTKMNGLSAVQGMEQADYTALYELLNWAGLFGNAGALDSGVHSSGRGC